MGAEGIRMEKPHEMEKALKTAQHLNQDGKTVLIEVIANSDASGFKSRNLLSLKELWTRH